MSPSTAPIVVIGGPTASGKSAAALALARHLVTQRKKPVILNADALQLYRDLHILSARPSAAEEAEVPHRLYGTTDGSERGSVGRWLEQIREELTVTLESGCQPIVVGGTGMYMHALMNGLAQIPEIPSEIRALTITKQAELGGKLFRQELAQLDPTGAAKIHENDPQRLIRAYEVVRATGKPLSEWQRELHSAPPAHWRFITFVTEPTRASLYARCDGRFDAMLAAGARAEVDALLTRQLDPDLPVMKAVGVPEIAAMIRGEWTLPLAREKAQQATRNYAKRQLTWFRHQLPSAYRLDTSTLDEAALIRAMAGIIRKQT